MHLARLSFLLSTPTIKTDWVRANSGFRVAGTLREKLTDFRVYEVFDGTFSGNGEHHCVHVEKRGMNTKDVQSFLAKHYEVSLLDVGYSGLKDKRAVAQQWFSIRLPKTAQRPKHDNFTVLKETRHNRKLRPGDHKENRFHIIVRGVSKNTKLASNTLQQPIPNYFGPQRFGYQFNNLQRAVKWADQSRPRVRNAVRAFHMSVLRSYVFNEVLATRVRDGTWCVPLSGDVLKDNFPTGPLWGRGQLPTSEQVLALEHGLREHHDAVCNALEWVGLKQERRSLAMQPTDVEIQQEEDTIELRFALPKGSYATVALNEYLDVKEPSK